MPGEVVRFETDLARIREEPMRLKQLKQDIDTIMQTIARMRDARQDVDSARPVPFEEYLRSEQHVHAITSENRSRYEHRYDEYTRMMDRRYQDALARLEGLRQRLKELLSSARPRIETEKTRFGELARTLSHLSDGIEEAQSHLELGASQITPDQIARMNDAFANHDWLKQS